MWTLKLDRPPSPSTPQTKHDNLADRCMIDEMAEDRYEAKHGHPSPMIPFGFNDCVSWPHQTSNNLHELHNKHDIVTSLHQACCSPVPSTWIKAIDAGHFTTWPGLTSDLVRKHLNKSVATTKRHLRQERQGILSTHPKPPTVILSQTKAPVMTAVKPSTVRTHWAFMEPIEITGKIFSNQTGRSPLTTSPGNKYIMVVYDYESNAIITKPITFRNKNKLLQAYTKIHMLLTNRGLKPILQKLDNKPLANYNNTCKPTTLPSN
jgi:hypothetical protein